MGIGGRFALGGTLFVISAAGLVLEIVAARLIAPYVGMSIYTWTAIIAVVLTGMSVGHWIGGRVAELPDNKALGWVSFAMIAASINTLAIPFLMLEVAPSVLNNSTGIVTTVVILSAALFLTPSVLIAFPSPILTRIAIDAEPKQRGHVIGRMFALGAGGAILGTLAAGFLFISWIGSQGTLIAISILLGLIGLGFAFWRIQKKAISALMLMLLVTGAFGIVFSERLLASACDVESKYYCIRVVDFESETERPSRLLVLDHMGHGINDRDDQTLLHSSYVDLADTLVRQSFGDADDLNTFFIGGGAYTLPRAWSKNFPAGRHVVAEIDPAVTKTAQERLWFSPDPSISIHHADARVVLRGIAEGSLDVVVGDAFHDFSVPQHLVTREFMAEIKNKLKTDGLYVMTVIDAAVEPHFLLAMLKTAFDVFPVVEIWGDTQQLASGGRMTYLLAAHAQAFPMQTIRSAAFFEREWVRVSPVEIAGNLSPDDVPILTDDFAPVDRLIDVVANTGQ